MSTGWDNKKEGGTGDILTQSFYPQQCCEEFLLNLRSRSSCCWDIKSCFSSFLVCLMLFVLGAGYQTHWHWIQCLHKCFQDREKLPTQVHGSVSTGRQREWQTCCHAVVGNGAKLGPFVYCLFISQLLGFDRQSRTRTAGNQEAVDARDLGQECQCRRGWVSTAMPVQCRRGILK